MNLPYILFGKSIRKAIYAGEHRPSGFDGMTFAFLDPDGNEYYTWPDVASMPAIRVKELEALMLMVDAGQPRSGILQLSDAIVKRANDVVQGKGKVKEEAASAIAVLARELTFRHREIVPEEAYYALAATCCARKDENPHTIDRPSHQRKMEAFRAGGQAGHAFFLACPPFRLLLGTSLATESALLELRSGWTQQNNRLQAVLSATSSEP